MKLPIWERLLIRVFLPDRPPLTSGQLLTRAVFFRAGYDVRFNRDWRQWRIFRPLIVWLIKRQMLRTCEAVKNSMLDTMQRGLALLEALEPFTEPPAPALQRMNEALSHPKTQRWF